MTTETPKTQTGEHPATNGEVRAEAKKWGLAQIAAVCVAFTTIGAFTTGFWSSAVEAGGRNTFVTVAQHAAVVKRVEALDAGMAKKEDVRRLELEIQDVKSEVKRSNDKMDELKNILLRQRRDGR